MSNAGILFGIAALLAFGIVRVLQSRLIHRAGVFTALFWAYVAEGAFVALVFALSGARLSPNLRMAGLALLLGVIGAAAIASFYRATQLGSVSIVSAVSQTFVVLTVALSLLFLGERLSWMRLGGVALAVSGAVLVSLKTAVLRLRLPRRDAPWALRGTRAWRGLAAGVPWAALTAVLWGVFFFAYRFLVADVGVIGAALLVELAVMLCFVIAAFRFRLRRLDARSRRLAAAVGFLVALGALAYNAGIAAAPVSLIAPLAGASPIVTALLARTFLHERLAIHQIAGIAVGVAGVVLLSV